VRADCLTLVKHTPIVAVGCDLCETATHDATFITLDLFTGTNLTTGKPIGVMRRHHQAFI
jgi:hypothetical protein